MGHLVNPIALRLAINTTWASNWSLINEFNYNTILKKDYFLFTFLNSFISRKNFIFNSFYISNYKQYRVSNNTFINLYCFSPLREDLKTYYIKRKFFYKLYINYYIKRMVLVNNTYEHLFSEKKKVAYNQIRRVYKYINKYLFSYLIFYVINNNINYYLNKYLIKERFKLNIYMLNTYSVTPEIITSYISSRLQQRYSLRWTLYPVFRDLNKKIKKGYIKGYKLLCSGRFTKRQIATYTWNKKGLLPLSKLTSMIRYSQIRIRLKFGLGGIKLWIYTGFEQQTWQFMNLVFPRYSPLKFIFNKKKWKLTFFFKLLKLYVFKNTISEI